MLLCCLDLLGIQNTRKRNSKNSCSNNIRINGSKCLRPEHCCHESVSSSLVVFKALQLAGGHCKASLTHIARTCEQLSLQQVAGFLLLVIGQVIYGAMVKATNLAF